MTRIDRIDCRPAPRSVPRRTAALLLAGVLLLSAVPATAQTYETAEELIDAVDARPEPETLQATMEMVLTNPSGRTLTREMRTWARGDDMRVMKFTAPADIAGSGFLMIDDGAAQETLVYLPALDRVRRVAGGQRGESFFGSDFSYEDVEGIDPGDYAHELVEVRDGPLYVVEATPKPDAESSYDRLVLEVPQDTLIPERVTYYVDDEAIKVLTVSDVQEVGGYLLGLARRMETLDDGSFTMIRQRDLTLDEDLPDEVFSERFLRR